MKISWYDHLYVGDKAKKKRYQIIQAIRNSRLISGAYVITPSLSGNNVLDIYPAMELSAPWYRDEEFFIIGIAADYWEALEVTMQIIVYRRLRFGRIFKRSLARSVYERPRQSGPKHV